MDNAPPQRPGGVFDGQRLWLSTRVFDELGWVDSGAVEDREAMLEAVGVRIGVADLSSVPLTVEVRRFASARERWAPSVVMALLRGALGAT